MAKASGPDLFPGTGSFWKDASSENTADERERREIKKIDNVITFCWSRFVARLWLVVLVYL